MVNQECRGLPDLIGRTVGTAIVDTDDHGVVAKDTLHYFTNHCRFVVDRNHDRDIGALSLDYGRAHGACVHEPKGIGALGSGSRAEGRVSPELRPMGTDVGDFRATITA